LQNIEVTKTTSYTQIGTGQINAQISRRSTV